MILVIVLLVVILSALIFVHELGHFISARRSGVVVEEFGFGFPPRLLSFKRGQTLYSLNLLPLGGFVRLRGEEADQGSGSFEAAKTQTKAKILLAGVAMNMLTAYILLVGLCLTGLPPFLADQHTFGHPTYAQPKQLLIVSVAAGSPAQEAGLKDGQYILSGNGQNFIVESDLSDFTKAHAGETVNLRVKATGVEKNLAIQLRPAGATDGYLGVVPLQVYKLRYSITESFWVALVQLAQLAWAVLTGIGLLIVKLPSLVSGLFTKSVPVAAEATAGPVGIFFILRSISALGAAYVLLFVINISVALAVFNALPIPALDGGRLAVILLQRALGRAFSRRVTNLIHLVGWVFLISLLAVVTVYDLRKFL